MGRPHFGGPSRHAVRAVRLTSESPPRLRPPEVGKALDDRSKMGILGNLDAYARMNAAEAIGDAARMVREHGARRIFLSATHGLFAGEALTRLANAEVEKVYVTDTVCPQADYPDVIEVLSVAPLLAEAIHRIHVCRSVSSLFVE